MPLTQLAPPYPIFTDKNGDPLDAGYLYFGVANDNPETNPITVYYDLGFTQPVAQPVRTSNGYVMRNGSPALIYADSNSFSITVRNKRNELVIYSPTGYGVTPGIPFAVFDNAAKDIADFLADTHFTYNPAITGTVQVSPGDILRTLSEGFSFEVAPSAAVDENITTAGGVKAYALINSSGSWNIEQFSGADDTTRFQNAANALSDDARHLVIPSSKIYQIEDTITITDAQSVTIESTMGPTNEAAPLSYLSLANAIAGPMIRFTGSKTRGNRVRGLWFRDPTSVLGGTQGTRAVESALHLGVFGMGVVEDCAFDGLQGSAIEITDMIRGHIVRPHVRDSGTPSRPALWLNPVSPLRCGQIAIMAPHMEVCRGVYLDVGANAVDTKIIGGQFEAFPALAASNQTYIRAAGDRTIVSANGFNRNLAVGLHAVGSRVNASGNTFSGREAGSLESILAAGSFGVYTGNIIVGSSGDAGTAIRDTGGVNSFFGNELYFCGNVILGSSSLWSGGMLDQMRTTETYCMVGGADTQISGVRVRNPNTAGGIILPSSTSLTGAVVSGSTAIGVRNDSVNSTIKGVIANNNAGGDFSFVGIPRGYHPNDIRAGDGIYPMQASDTWAPGLIASGASASRNITVTGVALGDIAQAQFPMVAGGSGVAGMQISTSVTGNNTVRVSISNLSGSPVTLDSGTLVVKAVKQ
jgi:hypothetical protein